VTDIIVTQYPSESYEGWLQMQLVLPNGYRHVGVVERPSADGNVLGKGEIYDLGQNAEGRFRLFRRGKGHLDCSHDMRGEPLSDADLAGFGLTRAHSPYDDEVNEAGEFSSLNKSHLILPS
jgi:hypothetical protein